MIKCFCDLCGKEMPEPEKVLYDEKYTYHLSVWEKDTSHNAYLCLSCMINAINYLADKKLGEKK